MKTTSHRLRFISSLAQAKRKLRQEKLAAESKKPLLRLVSSRPATPKAIG